MLFTTGIGEVELFVNVMHRLFPSVQYVPKLNKNFLSFDQLIDQCFDVIFDVNYCYIKAMFESDASSRKCDDNLNKNDIEKDRLNDVNEKLFDEFVVEKQKENFDIYLQEYCDDSTQQIQNVIWQKC
ncbi:hypothetical protein R6Q59_001556 [Mikania micrantha]